MYDGFWTETVVQNLAVPMVVILFGIALAIVQHYADKFVKLFIERQKVESVEKIASARQKLTQEIDSTTKSAVASTMDMVDEMKKSGKKLDAEQIATVNDSAKSIVFKSLPADISGMTPSEILGGEDVLNIMINASIEKYVLDYKIQRGMKTTPDTPIDNTCTSDEPVQCEDDLVQDAEQFPADDVNMLPMVESVPGADEDPNYGRETNDGQEFQITSSTQQGTIVESIQPQGIVPPTIILQTKITSEDGGVG